MNSHMFVYLDMFVSKTSKPAMFLIKLIKSSSNDNVLIENCILGAFLFKCLPIYCWLGDKQFNNISVHVHIQSLTHFDLYLWVFFFSVRLLSVQRGHSFFSSPPQWPMTKGFLYQILSITLFSYLNSWERASIFPFWMFSAKQGNYWYHFYNVFGMTRSLTLDWTRDFLHLMPVLYH